MPLLLLLLGLLGCSAAGPSATGRAAPAASSLDYEFFKTRVQPIFLAKRPGHARCITCHESGQPRLAALSGRRDDLDRGAVAAELRRVAARGRSRRSEREPAADASAGESRRAAIRSMPAASTGSRSRSRVPDAGRVGEDRHGQPVRPQSTAASGLDFEVYRTRIEPIFLKERAPNEGAGMCVNCHARIATRHAAAAAVRGREGAGRRSSRGRISKPWHVSSSRVTSSEERARHSSAGAGRRRRRRSTPGGKFWTTQDNPEWQAVSAWMKSANAGARRRRRRAPHRRSISSIFRTRVSTDLPGEAPGTRRGASPATRPASRGLSPLAEGATSLDRRAVAAELRGVAAGRRAGRPDRQPSADAPAGQDGGRRSVPCRRQALAVAERPRIANACRLDSR